MLFNNIQNIFDNSQSNDFNYIRNEILTDCEESIFDSNLIKDRYIDEKELLKNVWGSNEKFNIEEIYFFERDNNKNINSNNPKEKEKEHFKINIEIKTNDETKYTTKKKTKEEKDLIFLITKDKNKTKEKSILGRKRKNHINDKKSKHDKFSSDNIIRKINTKLFDSILYLLNSTIKKENINEIEKIYFLKVDQKIIKNININYIKKLFKTKIKDIFSKNISKKYYNYGLDYNNILIKKIYADKKQIKTIAILEKTFLECLEHFRVSKFYNELNGLEKKYQTVINCLKDNGETEEYIDIFKNLMDNYEQNYSNKIARRTRKNNEDYY
jgi:hypothetical protein